MDKPETIEEGLRINLIYKKPKVGMCILLKRQLPRLGGLNLGTQHTRLKKVTAHH